jgi:TolB-like protein/DNA-binding winged helix-turn-helix (wHTH) protein
VDGKATVRFEAFEFDLRAEQLWKNRRRVRLSTQPAQVLCALLQHPGEIVTREELQKTLWGDSHSADAEHSLNVAIAKVRDALGDSAEEPRFVATVARRGYRFIFPVTAVGVPPEVPSGTPATASLAPSVEPYSSYRRPGRWLLVVVTLAIVGLGLFFGSQRVGAIRAPTSHRVRVAILPFENLTGNPEQDCVADGLTEEIITDLGRFQPERLAVIARTSVMPYKKSGRTVREIGRELGIDYLVEGSIRANGPRTRITAQLIRVQEESQLWADTYDRGELEDLLGVEIEVARHVAAQIQLVLDPRLTARLDHPIDARAHTSTYWAGTNGTSGLWRANAKPSHISSKPARSIGRTRWPTRAWLTPFSYWLVTLTPKMRCSRRERRHVRRWR